MPHCSLKHTPDISFTFRPDLEWSFRPMFLCLKSVGLPFGQSNSSSTVRRNVFFCGRMMILLWIVATNSYILYQLKPSHLSAERWSGPLGPLANVLVTINLFWLAHMQWAPLWNTVIEMVQILRLDETSYRSIRKVTVAALILFMLVNRCRTSHFGAPLMLLHILTIVFVFHDQILFIYRK